MVTFCRYRGYRSGMIKLSNTSSATPTRAHANDNTTSTQLETLPRLAYTMRETAEILGVSYITVWRLLQRGKLHASDAIRNKIIPRAEIDRFLQETIEQGGRGA